MAKTETTLDLERKLWNSTNKLGVFSCFEVTIGFGGNERVDYLTYNTKGIWRCYEIKVSKEDFYSKAAKTFVGHFNYYVMPKELFEQVKEDIPKHIGVHTGYSCIKNAKKQELDVDEQILKDSMIRSLHRENEKFVKTCDNKYINQLKSTIERYKKKSNENYKKYNKCTVEHMNNIIKICDVYGLDYKEVRKLIRND